MPDGIPEGFKTLTGLSTAEDHIGPFYYRKAESGLVLGFQAGDQHCNGLGSVHGGLLMAFADYAVTMIALAGVAENCTTVSFSSHFLSAAQRGDWLEARGEVVRRTGSMTFVRGLVTAGDAPVLDFQAAVKRLKKPSESA